MASPNFEQRSVLDTDSNVMYANESLNYSDHSLDSSFSRPPLAELNQNSEIFNNRSTSAITAADSDDTDYEMHSSSDLEIYDEAGDYNSSREYSDPSIKEATRLNAAKASQTSLFRSHNVKPSTASKPLAKSTPNSIPRLNLVLAQKRQQEQNKPKNPSPLSSQVTQRDLVETRSNKAMDKTNRILDFIPKMGIPHVDNTPDEFLKATVLERNKGNYAKLTTPSPKKLEPKHALLLRSHRIQLQQRAKSEQSNSSSDSDRLFRNGNLLSTKRRRQPSQFNGARNSVDSGSSNIGTDKSRKYYQDDDWQDEFPDYTLNNHDDSQLSSRLGSPNSTVYVDRDNSFYSSPEAPLPIVLSSYLQLFFNLILVSIFVYLVYVVVSTIRHDVDLKVEEYSQDILNEIAQCSNEYIRNNCMPGRRVPALEKTCSNWEKCMNQDPAVVGRARVSAETFAEIINSFIEPFGLKAMAFILILFLGAVFVNNIAFGMKYRQSMYSQPPPRAPTPHLLTPKYPKTPKYYYTPRSTLRSRKRQSPRRILLDR